MYKTITAIMVMGLLQAGCSSEQLYAAGRGAQRDECMKQADFEVRERCFKDANMSHDAYRKEVDAARK